MGNKDNELSVKGRNPSYECISNTKSSQFNKSNFTDFTNECLRLSLLLMLTGFTAATAFAQAQTLPNILRMGVPDHAFTVNSDNPDWNDRGDAVGTMVSTDLVNINCPNHKIELYEMSEKFRKAREQEQQLCESGAADKSTCPATWPSLVVNYTIGGSVNISGNQVSITIQMKNAAGSVVQESTVSQFYDEVTHEGIEAMRGQALAQLAGKLCSSSGYLANGGQNITISGTICGGLSKPFTLHGVPPDGSSVTFSYVPSSEQGGAYSYAGSGGGFTFSGKGNYIINPDQGGNLTLMQSDQGCVIGVPGSCKGHSNSITLTPAKSCGS